MPAPPEVVQWLKRTYPQPTVDPEWLEGCYGWIQDELHLNPARDMAAIMENVNTQLLESDFADSMVAGTGIPQNMLGAEDALIKGPILVEITGIMEIGHSAYSLLQICESREEYRKQSAIRDASGDQEERKPMPKFPRSMLQIQLSDGVSVLPAIEFKPLPQLELGETPLGYKIVIRNVTIRRGTALLGPQCVDLKGHRTADRDERRATIFLCALKLRLGEAMPDEELPVEVLPIRDAPAPIVALAPVVAPTPVVLRATPPRVIAPIVSSTSLEGRSPLRDMSPPPKLKSGPSNAATMNLLERDDDMAEPRRRKLPKRATRTPSPPPQLHSRYYAKLGAPSNPKPSSGSQSPVVTITGPGSKDAMREFARAIRLSPPRLLPIHVPASEEVDNPFAAVSVRHCAAAGKQQSKQKLKKETMATEPSSDDFGFDYEIDDSFLEQVDLVEQEALNRDNMRAQLQTQVTTQTRVTVEQSRTQSRTQATTLYGTGARSTASTTVVGPSSNPPTSSSGPAISVSATSSRGSKANLHQTRDADMDVIDISDEEEHVDKENMPVPTRHVRRRIATRAEEDVIELSD